MCRSANDLVFAEPDLSDADGATSGPIQLFDIDGTMNQRRQSQGRISWSSIVVPFTNEPDAATIERWSYRMYVLVYKNRQFESVVTNPDGTIALNADGTVRDLGGSMTVALLDTSLTGPQSPVSILSLIHI